MTPIAYYSVHLSDEAPAIGSGRRRVLALEGQAWVHLASPTLKTARLPLARWRTLPKRSIELTPARKRRLRAMMRRWRRHRRRTVPVERVERAIAG